MRVLSAFLPAIFNLFIVAFVAFGILKKLKGTGVTLRKGNTNPNVNNFSEMVSHYNKVNNRSSSLKHQESMTLKDDRSSDWMAKQMRDEALAMANVSEMFQLKNSHMNNCEAEFIKRFHESSCDASGIDNGSPKKRSGR